jgi:beta-glucosidase
VSAGKALTAIALCLASPALAAEPSAVANPALWPKLKSAVAKDPKIEARIDRLLAAMSIEDKVGQLLQVDIASINPADLVTYKLGSVLNGGTSGPYGNDKAPASDWLKLADEFYDASMTRTDGRPKIPVIWGTDAVHGNNNVPGAILFPHNIGLGAARDPDLVRRIGAVTALETAVAGQGWTFAPTVAVAQDDRWGRTYESYSEEPSVVRALSGAMVEGLQGKAGTPDFLSPRHVVSSTKHFLGDGGTGGRDQGDTRVPERTLIDIHFAGYVSAIEAGAQIVMVSFSSWNGVKMTGNKSLMTDVLKGRVGFDGFLVSDWNGHGQVPGCTADNCAAAINAGLDMFMYSGRNWKKLYENTLAQAKSGEIPAARVDDAVRRILRVKLRAGLFEAGRPSAHPYAGDFKLIGADEHRALAREAVRKSLVLLKNDGVLPLKPSANILVAGRSADSIAQASGGWSISWQGDNTTNADFPHGDSIWGGIEKAVKAGGGTATLSPDGSFSTKPDAAIVVFGEKPYAEILGDRPNLEYSPADKSDLELLRKLKAAGVPVVAVFLSGRPLWVNAEINASSAFVAAFLPGSEGGGVADLLFRKPDGAIAYDFTGKLAFSWPKRPDQYVLNRRDAGYDPLFAYGYGLSYRTPGKVAQLAEARPAGIAMAAAPVWGHGTAPEGWGIVLYSGQAQRGTAVLGPVGSTFGNGLTMRAVDRRTQEDARAFAWGGRAPAEVRIEPPRPIDLSKPVAAGESLIVDYRVDTAPMGTIEVGMVNADLKRVVLPVTTTMKAAPVGSWQTIAVPLTCFAAAGLDTRSVAAPFVLASSAAAGITVSDVRFGPSSQASSCP